MQTLLFTLLACGGADPKPAPKPVAEAPKPAPPPAPVAPPEKSWDEIADGDKHDFLMTKGKDVYLNSTLACSTCHGAEGVGQSGVFPPLVGTKDLMGDCVRHAAIVVYGLQGEIEVAGVKYNGVMTPQGAMLDDTQIAAVITYERNSWGNDYGDCTPDDVKKARESNPL